MSQMYNQVVAANTPKGSGMSPYASLAPAANEIVTEGYSAITGYEDDKAWEDSGSFMGLGQGISYATKDAEDYFGELDQGFEKSKGQQDSFDQTENPFDNSFGGNVGRLFDSATDGFSAGLGATGDPVTGAVLAGANFIATGVGSLFSGDLFGKSREEEFEEEQERRMNKWNRQRNQFVDDQLEQELEASRSGAMERRMGSYEAIPYNTTSIYNV
tara:strand:- start:629 stop:1273 length:645 start_codon:yes stop_codon:yes gene_type:complete